MPDRTETLWRQLRGVRAQERSRFRFFVTLATFISLGQTIGLAGSEALFLAQYGAEALPVAFIAAALFTVFGSMLYAARVGTVHNDKLYTQMLAGAAIVLAGCAVAVQAGITWLLPFLFCSFYLTQAVFLNHLWTFTADYFDTVASKRLVPLFTIGGSIGGAVGGLFVFGTTKIVGPVSLIYAWALVLGAAAVLVRAYHHELLRWGPIDDEESDETSVEGIQAAMRYLGTSPLGRWLSVSAMAMMLSLFVAQYLYSDIFASAFPTSGELAAFFGIYLAATNAIEILVEVKLTPLLISRLSVPVANLLHPILTLASFGGLSFQYGLGAATAARVNRELVENAISGPVRALVYNAMPMRYRGRTRAFLEGIIVYAGMALAGLLLLPFEDPDPRWLCGIGGAVAIVYLGANVVVRREYLRTLVSELRAGRLDLSDLGEEVGHSQALALAEIWEQLLQEERELPSRSLLDFIPSLASRGLVEPLVRAVGHPHPEVRRASIEALAASQVEDAAGALLAALDDPDPRVRLAALRALQRGHESQRTLEPLLRRLLEDDDPLVRAEAAAHTGETGAPVIERMIRSQITDVAVAALQCAPSQATGLAAERVADDNPFIRAAAIECLARYARLPVCPVGTLYDIARDPHERVREAGMRLLAHVEHGAVGATLAAALADPSPAVRAAAEAALSSREDIGPQAVLPLLRDRRERVVMRGMRVLEAVGGSEGRALLYRELRFRSHELWRSTVAFTDLPAGEGVAHAFLRAAFQDDILRNRRLCFRILELLEDATVVRRVDNALQRSSPRGRGDALEVLSHLGDREAARLLTLIHETGPLTDRLPEIATVVRLAQTAEEIVEAGCDSESYWIRMACRAIAAPDAGHEEEIVLMERLLALRQVPLLSKLSLEQLEAVRQITRERHYLPGDCIVVEGDAGGELFLLMEGQVRFVKDLGTPNEDVKSRQAAVGYFGEMAALDNQRRSLSVVAEGECQLLSLDGERLKDLIRQMPEISFQIMNVLTARVRAAEEAARRG